MKKEIKIYNTREKGEMIESYLKGTTCENIEVFEDGSINIHTKNSIITFKGFPYRLEIIN